MTPISRPAGSLDAGIRTASRRDKLKKDVLMRRREFLMGAAATLAAATPGFAAPPKAFRQDMAVPLTDKVGLRRLGRRQSRRGREISRAPVRPLQGSARLQRPLHQRRKARLPARRRARNSCCRTTRTTPMSATISTSASASPSRPPGTMGRMTSSLGIKPGDKVLEIGTGSGFQSALLTYLTPRVYSIEIIPELAQRTRGVYDRLIAAGYSGIFRHRDAQRRRLFRLGRGGAVRQDHRHLRHRPHPAAAPAAIEAERHHGHPRRPARRAAHPQGGQEDGRGRHAVGRALRHFRRQDHPLRAAERRPSASELMGEKPAPQSVHDGLADRPQPLRAPAVALGRRVRRTRAKRPRPANPISPMAQVEGSGMAARAKSATS